MPVPESLITGVILAGGRARRLGGRDKGLITLAGRPLIQYVIDAVRPQVKCLLVSANRHLDEYRRFGLPVLEDRIPDYAGPLAGVAAALEASKTPYILTSPCDGPFIAPDMVARLFNEMKTEDARLCTAHDGKRLQPAYALIARELLSDIDEYLQSGNRGLTQWLERHPFAVADFADQPECFINLNTPSDITRAEILLKRVKSTKRN